MKLRIISDLHLDVNFNVPLSLEDKDVFTLIAGDVAGDPSVAVKWLRENVHNGIVVAGNHMVYNKTKMPIEDLREFYAGEFPVENCLTYLDCLTEEGVFTKEVNGILFMGSTLYTDYKLPVSAYLKGTSAADDSVDVRMNMLFGQRFLNDFVWGTTRDGGADRIYLTPEHYLKWFEKTLKLFDDKLTEIEKTRIGLPVVIVTHHGPSTGCIAKQYIGSSVNSSFVSDLDWFIKKHPSIKLWNCGHVHNRFAFKVGSCLVVANPRGYCRVGETKNWNPNLTVDTDSWEIENE